MESLMKLNLSDLRHLMDNLDALPSEGIQEILTEILQGNEFIGWEIGPDPIDYAVTVLALSCHGDKGLLKDLEKDIDFPVVGDCWRIVVGVPPKSWQGYFEIEKDNGDVIPVEGWSWKWREVERDCNGLTVQVLFPPSPILDKDDIKRAGEVLLFGTIGEVNVANLLSVDGYFVIDKNCMDCRSVKHLREEFARGFPEAPYCNELMDIK
jgi:hypothetical protein